MRPFDFRSPQAVRAGECEAAGEVDASDYERPAVRHDAGFTHLAGCRCTSCAPKGRTVSGALTVGPGVVAGLLLSHEPTAEWPTAHRFEVRATWLDGSRTASTGGTAPTFREAWAAVLAFVEREVRP